MRAQAKPLSMTRDDLDRGIARLCEKYPKTFFMEPRQRVPLKKFIVADLEKDGAVFSVTAPVVDFYTTHWSYQYALQAGVDRIDLKGNKAGTVTEAEHRVAVKKINDERQAQKERTGYLMNGGPVAVLTHLHSNGHIPDDQLRKIDMPIRKRPEPPQPQPPEPPSWAPPLPSSASSVTTRLQKLVASLEKINVTDDEALNTALTVATLNIVIAEAQKIVRDLTPGGA